MHLSLPLVDYLVVIFYLILMLAIGFYFSRFMKGGKDFFIGGNSIPWWVAGLSLYMTLFSAWTFTGAASFAYNTGWYGILYFLTWPISFFIGFQLSARRWRRTRITSPVEYVQNRFNKTTHAFLSIMLIFSSAYWPAQHLASLAKITAPTLFPNSIMAIDIMIVVVGLIILIYSFTGGLWAVCVTDVVQFLIFFSICAVLLPTIFLSGDVGSFGDFLRSVPPLKLTHILRDNTTYNFWYLLGIPASFTFSYAVGGNAQRYYSVRDEKSAYRVGLLAFLLFLLSPVLFGIPPLVGKVLWPDVSMIEYFSHIAKADENIFIAVVMRYMPAGLIGVFLAAMMSASMSAMDSGWNATSAIISIDVYKRFFNPHADEKKVLQVGRLATVGLCLFAMAMALTIIHSQYGVFSFSNIFFGLTGIPINIPLLLGILTRKISRWSAISSIICGTLVASIARFVLKCDLGPQYLLTVGVTLFFLFASPYQGKLFHKSRVQAIAASVAIGLVFWFSFMLFNANENLGFAQLQTWQPQMLAPLFWITLASGLFVAVSIFFSRLYAKDLLGDQQPVDEFFAKLDTPIDVDKEVAAAADQGINMLTLIGAIAAGLSLLVLLLILTPHNPDKSSIYYAVSAVLMSIGLLMFGLQRMAIHKA